MPFGEDIYQNDGTTYSPATPAAFGCVEVKKMLKRRAGDLHLSIPSGFDVTVLAFGSKAESLCATVQGALGLPMDGRCGPATMRAGFKYDLQSAAQAAGLEFETICKLISLESGFNPSAFNPAPYKDTYSNGTCDKGIAQKNGSPIDDRFWDVLTAFSYSCMRLSAAIADFGDLDVAIASYNVGITGAGYYQKGRDYWNLYQTQVC